MREALNCFRKRRLFPILFFCLMGLPLQTEIFLLLNRCGNHCVILTDYFEKLLGLQTARSYKHLHHLELKGKEEMFLKWLVAH